MGNDGKDSEVEAVDIMMLQCKHHDVRTTLTLDDDVAKLLDREARRSGASFKETVNRYLRLGLMHSKPKERKPVIIEPRPMGLPPGLSYDKVEELIEYLEGPLHK